MYLSYKEMMLFNYFAIFLVVAVGSLASYAATAGSHRPRDDGKDALYLILLGYLLVVMRTKGWDVEEYYNIFHDATGMAYEDIGRVEPGYSILMVAVKSLWNNFFFFNAVFGFLSICVMFKAISVNSRSFAIGFFLLFLFYFFRGPYGQIRQAFSIFCFLWSLTWLVPGQRKYWAYFLINGLAATIHSVSVLAFVFPLFALIKVRWWHAFGTMVIVWACLVLDASDQLINKILIASDLTLVSKAKMYIELFPAEGSNLNPDTTRIFLALSLIAIRLKNGFENVSKLDRIQYSAILFGALLYGVFAFDFRMASRLSSLFLTVDVFIYANIIFMARTRGRRNLLLLFFSMLGLAYLVMELYMMSKAEIKYTWGF